MISIDRFLSDGFYRTSRICDTLYTQSVSRGENVRQPTVLSAVQVYVGQLQ